MKYLLSLVLLSSLLFLLSNCQPVPHAEGRALAATYCSNCHILPSPDELTREIWLTEVLPLMGAFYGIYEQSPREKYLKNEQETAYLGHLFPTERALDSTEWAAITAYYLAEAPNVLPVVEPEQTLLTMDQFKVHQIRGQVSKQYRPLTTMIVYDEEKQRILTGGEFKKTGIFHSYNADHQLLEEMATASPPVAYDPATGGTLTIGSLIPSDLPLGSFDVVDDRLNRSNILDSLRRPLDVLSLDLNLDGEPETIIAEYGNMTGRLQVYPSAGASYALAETPGAIKLQKADLNKDGYDDLVVLFAQGDERIVVYYASPNGTEQQLLYQFPPSYGSADFVLGDIDNDQDVDIISVNGDNYDYQPIPKPYHGVRILENNQGKFRETWFYPLDGAYGIAADDFDGDGDLDLAAIAYFVPVAKRGIRSFVYLEQKKIGHFQPFGFEKSKGQHFICLAKGDTDGDGDQDLLIGNFASYLPDGGAGGAGKTAELPVYLWLENVQ